MGVSNEAGTREGERKMTIRQDNADKAISNLAKMTGTKIDMYNAKKYLNSMVGQDIPNCENTGMQVYVLLRWAVYDYDHTSSIEGVFSTMEKAEKEKALQEEIEKNDPANSLYDDVSFSIRPFFLDEGLSNMVVGKMRFMSVEEEELTTPTLNIEDYDNPDSEYRAQRRLGKMDELERKENHWGPGFYQRRSWKDTSKARKQFNRHAS